MEYNFRDFETPSNYKGEVDKKGFEGNWPSQGKCDLRDSLCMIGVKEGETVSQHVCEFVRKSTFVVDEFVLKNTVENILPYMFSIVSGSFSSDRNYIYLSRRPWLDIEEHESLIWKAERIFKYFRYIKSHNISDPTFEKFMEWNKCWEGDFEEKNKIYKVMFDRYYKCNYKHSEHKDSPRASMEDLVRDIHTSWKNGCRENLIDFCVAAGVDPNHPMLRKYRSDVMMYYALINDMMDKSYWDGKEFWEAYEALEKKRGWVCETPKEEV